MNMHAVKKLITTLLHPETKDTSHSEREISEKGIAQQSVNRKLQLAEIAFPTGKVELALSRTREVRFSLEYIYAVSRQESRSNVIFAHLHFYYIHR